MRFQVTTVVWGDRYIDVFLQTCLPSMLASRNLPGALNVAPGRFTIYTTAADRERLEAAPEIAAVRSYLPVQIKVLQQLIFRINPHLAHGRVWTHACNEARALGEWVILAPPDVVWANGSIENMLRAFAEGRSAQYLPSLRVIEHTFLEAIAGIYRTPNGAIEIPARALVGLALEHLSPLATCTFRDNPYYSRHSEQVGYACGKQGMILAAPFCNVYAVDPQAHPELRESFQIDEGYFSFASSDQVFFVSLSPLTQQSEWYFTPRSYTYLTHATNTWEFGLCKAFPSVFRTVHEFAASEHTSIAWGRQKARARLQILLSLISLKLVWLCRALHTHERVVASKLLCLAVVTGRLHRYWRWRGPISVVIPPESDLESCFDEVVDFTPKQLNEYLLSFVSSSSIVLPESDGGAFVFKNVFGAEVRFSQVRVQPLESEPDLPPQINLFSVERLPA